MLCQECGLRVAVQHGVCERCQEGSNLEFKLSELEFRVEAAASVGEQGWELPSHPRGVLQHWGQRKTRAGTSRSKGGGH